MKKKSAEKWIIALTVVGLLSMGSVALANWERGPGYGPCWGNDDRGSERTHRPHGDRRWMANLTEEQVKQLKAARKAFFDATGDLRQAIRVKHLELRAELAKKAPDSEKALALQKELSGFKDQMAQKRIEHLIKLKAQYPEADQWFRAKRSRGAGGPGYGGCKRW